MLESGAIRVINYLAVQCVSKNDTGVAYYNFNAHQPISLIFGTYIAE